jgi:acyl transferase domain-containing protein/glutamate-1-semialdehyde aminotransferase/acyl-CoA synthetase (AMP-forming)/AMP-acid ligase II
MKINTFKYKSLADAFLYQPTSDKGITIVNSSNSDLFINYNELKNLALNWLRYLQKMGVKSEDKLILVTDDLTIATSVFWACIIGKIIVVPIAIPTNSESEKKIKNIYELLDHPWCLSDVNLHDIILNTDSLSGTMNNSEYNIQASKRILNVADYFESKNKNTPILPNTWSSDDVVMLQFSSGSTGTPKGVMLTNSNLLTNTFAFVSGMRIDPQQDSILSWMPLTHDFGIIFCHILPVIYRISHVLIPTKLFVRNPLIWMQKISDTNATITAGPDYSYRYFLKRYKTNANYNWNLSKLRIIANGAEPINCDLVRQFLKKLEPFGLAPNSMLPGYGLAEGTLTATMVPTGEGLQSIRVERLSLTPGKRIKLTESTVDGVELCDLGYPALSVELRITDNEGLGLTEELVGNIEIAGPSVTQGYFNAADATRAAISSEGWLDTGDLGFIKSGRLFVTGRKKDIIIINGINYYPQDIERIVSGIDGIEQNMVAACAVTIPVENREGLALFVRSRRGVNNFLELIETLEDHILSNMGMPLDYCLEVPQIPKTTSGKVQRFLLAQQFSMGVFDKQILEQRTVRQENSLAPVTPLPTDSKLIQSILLREIKRFYPNENWLDVSRFETSWLDLGFTSLMLVELVRRINRALNINLQITDLFDFPNINLLTTHLTQKIHPKNSENQNSQKIGSDVAIIGMAVRLPGKISTLDEFWNLLVNGHDATTLLSEDRRSKIFTNSTDNLRGGYLSDDEQFDCRFFNLTPVEAEAMDPRQRLLLTMSWEAFEHAGVDPVSLRGASVGVYTGISGSDSLIKKSNAGKSDALGPYSLTGSAISIASGRLSYIFGLEGPNLTVDTACSSSMAAVHMAVKSLRSGDCELALATSINLVLNNEVQLGLMQMGALSSDGHCKAFDASADGYARGEGGGAVVLKILDRALADGDRVLAVIKGIGLNHDGASNGLTAPSGVSQQKVVRQALADAQISPREVDYVEAHGTGTSLGDPIEVMALAAVHSERKLTDTPLWLGSVKSNVAHLEAAAGMASLAKLILALEHGVIPASLHVKNLNPMVLWDSIPVKVTDDCMPWPKKQSDKKRIAGLSSFGMSGTNVHLILEQPDQAFTSLNSEAVEQNEAESGLLLLSARNDKALKELILEYHNVLTQKPQILNDLCMTAARGRSVFSCRAGFSACSPSAMLQALSRPIEHAGHEPVLPRKVAFVFSGQGSQIPGMGKALFDREPVFRECILRAEKFLINHLPLPLTQLMFSVSVEEQAQTRCTQVLVVAFGLAMVELLKSWGIKPDAVMGHSIGEITAATVAGVFTFETALEFAAKRGALMQDLADGSMMSIAGGVHEAQKLLDQMEGKLTIAAINGPSSLTLAGERDVIELALVQCKDLGVRAIQLDVTRAFHSKMMNPILPSLENCLNGLNSMGQSEIPLYSTLTGELVSPLAMCESSYWSKHAREPVLFGKALNNMYSDLKPLIFELGAKTVLAPIGLSNHPDNVWLPCSGDANPLSILDATLVKAFEMGINLNLHSIFSVRQGKRGTAPFYPFQGSMPMISDSHLSEEIPLMSTKTTKLQNSISHLDSQALHNMDNTQNLKNDLIALIGQISGLPASELEPDTNWFALGMDSLLILQLQMAVCREFQVDLKLNDVFQHGTTLNDLLKLIHSLLPKLSPESFEASYSDTFQSTAVAPDIHKIVSSNAQSPIAAVGSGFEELLTQQVQAMSQLFRQQLEIMSGNINNNLTEQTQLDSTSSVIKKQVEVIASPSNEIKGLYKKIPTQKVEWSNAKKSHALRLATEFNKKTTSSKEHTQKFRSIYANPRSVIGFRPEWKELTYPLHVERASGAYVWDIDGHRYIDITMGFGVSLFGHNVSFVNEAIAKEISLGAPLGPQTPKAARVASMICEMTGVDRVAFFSTGSEATMVAARLARSVTGRSKIIIFTNSYHGTFDGFLATGWMLNGKATSLPIAEGTPQQMIDDTIVLRYGDDTALEYIRTHATELAAVFVEPVQSRDPKVQPGEFLKALRKITEENACALVFDEIIMGFRIHPRGAQHYFGVIADIVTYGKVLAGGLPIGVVAGKRKFLDAVDGGEWQFGNESTPASRTAFVAGTFNNHPLTMAATEAVLLHLNEQGPILQEALNERTLNMVNRLNTLFVSENVPISVSHFGSLFRFDFSQETEILNYHLLNKGVFVWEGRNCFLSTAHSDEDIDFIVEAVRSSILEMKSDSWMVER